MAFSSLWFILSEEIFPWWSLYRAYHIIYCVFILISSNMLETIRPQLSRAHNNIRRNGWKNRCSSMNQCWFMIHLNIVKAKEQSNEWETEAIWKCEPFPITTCQNANQLLGLSRFTQRFHLFTAFSYYIMAHTIGVYGNLRFLPTHFRVLCVYKFVRTERPNRTLFGYFAVAETTIWFQMNSNHILNNTFPHVHP